MPEPAWFESFFGPDYFEIYRDGFSPEATAAEAGGIAALLALAPGARVLDLASGHGRHAIALAPPPRADRRAARARTGAVIGSGARRARA